MEVRQRGKLPDLEDQVVSMIQQSLRQRELAELHYCDALETAGRVLGLDDGLRIVHGSISGQVEIAPGGRKRARYIDSDARMKLHIRSRKKVKASGSQASSFSSGKSFVPIATGKQKQKEDRDAYLGHEFAGTIKKAASSEPTDEDEGIGSSEELDSDDDSVSPQRELQERLKVLDNKVRVDGGDTASWLALVKIQEEVVEMAVRQDRVKAGRAEIDLSKDCTKIKQTIAEVQMSVLERASRAHPSNAASLTLTMAKLELAASSQVWDSTRTDREWRQAINSYLSDWDASEQLWNSFLTWKMKDSDSFVLRDMLKTFAEVLQFCRTVLFHQQSKSEDRDTIEMATLHIVERLVDMLLQAGYTEQAYGLLQAQSELIFRRPDDLVIGTEHSFRHSCGMLKDYWDLEERRMGEAASTGWAAFQERLSSNPESFIKAESVEETTSLSLGTTFPKDLDDPDPIVRWLTLEKARAELRHFSAKEDDEADWTTGELEVDPFSVVLFDDIAPFMMPVESEQGKDMLMDMFLSVLGVSGNGSNLEFLHSAQSERIWPSHLDDEAHTSSWVMIGGQLMQRPKTSALSDPFRTPIKTWRPRLDEMFPVRASDAEPWFASWETLSKDRVTIAETHLEQIKGPLTAAALAQLGLCEVAQSHKAAKKLAKVLLNQDRDNVVLWRAFARLERNNGNLESARTVYMSLLVASHSANELGPVWSEWAELEWEAGQRNTSLSILIFATKRLFGNTEASSISGTKQHTVSTLEVLRTRRALDQMLSSSDCEFYIIFCAALFRYLSQDADEAFESAMTVFQKAMDGNHPRKHLEDIAMTHCKFIWRHIHGNGRMKRSRAYIPKHITAIFSSYVNQFPHNSAFVSLLAAFEMTTKVENVLRGVLEDKMRQSKDAASEQHWLEYLYCELHMNLHSVNENAIRRLFERALQSKRTSASSVLWQFYLQFEVKLCRRKVAMVERSRARAQAEVSDRDALKEATKSEQRQCKAALIRAKSILYRAIQCVPYCKALYLTAFAQPLRQVFSLDELLQLFQVMQEKDLRLYTDLSAFVTPSDGFFDTTSR